MKKRIISAVVMLIIIIPILILGGIPFLICSSILGILALYELNKVVFKEKKEKKLMIFSYIFLITSIILNKVLMVNILDYRLLILYLLILLSFIVLVDDKNKYNVVDAFMILGISLLVTLPILALNTIRDVGIVNLAFILIIAVLTDTFAYFIGSYFGKRKISSLSRNKSLEGLIGGGLSAMLGGGLFYYFLIDTNLNIAIIFVMCLILSLIGQVGDLVFSSIKRTYDVKDFSNLIPGHGGILDRLDSIIFISLMYLLFLNIL